MKKTLVAMLLLLMLDKACTACAQTPTFSDYAPYMLGDAYVEGYVNSTADYNVWPTDTATYTTVESWFGPDAAGHWYAKTGSAKAIDGTAFQGKDSQAPPQLTMTVTGLDDTEEYQVYAVCWVKNPAVTSHAWYTRAALTGESLIDCSYQSADNIFFDDGGSGVQGCEKLLGTVSGVTEFSVIVEAPPNTPDLDLRAWFDGISTRGPQTFLSTVEARFAHGNTLSEVDGYLGVRGDGWNDAWRIRAQYPAWATATVLTPGDFGYSELKPGQSGNYLEFDATHSQNTNYTGLTRSYKSNDVGIDWSQEHSIQFSVRIDEDLSAGGFTHVDDRYQFSNIDNGYNSDSSSTWMVACYGGSDEDDETPLANPEDVGVWTFYDGGRDGAARTAERNVASDIAVTSGQVYDFTIVVDPLTQSYDATVSDGTNSFTATDLGWRTAATEIGQWLVFDTRAGDVTFAEHRLFSLDDIVITQLSESIPGDEDADVPEPGIAALLTIAMVLLTARRPRSAVQRSIAKTGCVSVMVLVATFSVTARSRADVDPADYMTITPIREIGSATNELGYASSKINSTSFKQQSLTTIEAPGGAKYQFSSYYDQNKKLVVGRRKMLTAGWSDWYLRRTAFTAYSINDAHDVSSIGVDGDGYLHISWGMHGNPMLYTRSTTSALGDDPFVLHGDMVGNSAGLGSEMPHTSDITYPLFYNIPGSGDLLFSYRTGSSGNGDLQLVRWDNAGNSWNAVHAGTGGNPPCIDGDYFGDTLPSVNAYTNYATFDSDGNWHLTWTWRTGGDSPTPFHDYQSNHNIMYAWSPNQGVDWYRQALSRYSRSGIHAIDESNAPPVVVLPEGSSLINQTYMMAGPNGNPYVATWWAPNAAEDDHLRQYMLAWQDGETWSVSQITDREPENTDAYGVSQRVPEDQLRDYRITRPIVAVDDSDRVIVAFTDWQRGGKLTIAYSESPDRDDWVLFDLPTANMEWWEPNLDLNRWNSERVISMFYQVEDLGSGPTVVHTLEWDAEAYFAALAVPVPGDATCNGVVDEEDLERLAANWGESGIDVGWVEGDFDGDHVVGPADAAILAAHWGHGTSEANTVPEPSAVVLLAVGALLGLAFHRR